MSNELQPEWRAEHVIRSYDVGPNRVARLPVFCGFMQEAAYSHAEHLGVGYTQLSRSDVSWVLSRMRIEVARLPKWGETIKLRTWPSGRDRLYYYRDFEITDEEGAPVLLASTAWFVIDLIQRERVVPTWWRTQEYPFSPKVFDSKLARLKGRVGEAGEALTVNHGDLDQNGHVSNIRYVEWMLNGLPLEFHQAREIKSLDVNYLAEARHGQSVSIHRSALDEPTIEHGISSGGTELFRARSTWTAS